MDTYKYVDSLFEAYEETTALADFKEELRSNLEDKIASFIKKGISREEAFVKATAELGDIAALADEISLTKKKEAFSQMYMKTRNYMNTKRIAFYVILGAIFCFGIIVALTTYFIDYRIEPTMGSMLVFCGIPILGFVFMGLTQETATHEPMSVKRACWYVLASGVFLFGVFVSTFSYLLFEKGAYISIGSLIPFVLPSGALGVFLVLTEKDRRKSWVRKLVKEQTEYEMGRFADPVEAERFGLISGALWIAAIALFFILVIKTGLLYSWIVLVAALIIQMLILAMFPSGKYNGKR